MAAPNVGPTQGMVASVDHLGILVAAQNVGSMQGMVALVLDSLGSLAAAPNACLSTSAKNTTIVTTSAFFLIGRLNL